jgi:histidine triad (HIT) family protein
MHLVPLNGIADINFDRPKLKPSSEELAAVAARIRG